MSDPSETDTDRWARLHTQLQDLLAGYADAALDRQQNDIVEAHLAGCAACRRDVARQQALSRRLHSMPVAPLSADLHERLDQALGNAPPAPGLQAWLQRTGNLFRIRGQFLAFDSHTLAWVSGWGLALVLAIMMVAPTLKSGDDSDIPMVRDVLAEYRLMSNTALPEAGNTATAEPPVSWPNARLLATWKTRVGGAPAQAFAVRNGHSIVFQYRVDETVFFRNPVVRQAVAQNGDFRIRADNMEVLAVPLKDAGVLVVGPADSLPAYQQLSF